MSQENKTPDIKFLLQEADNHYKSDSIEQAIKIYKYVLAQDPNQPHANGMMAQITYRMKIYDLAEQFIRRALESHDGRTAIHYKTSGDILRDKQNIDGAITNYKKAVELDNKYTEALNNLGTALMLSGKSEEAKTYYERSLQINPNNAILMYNLASILENENKHQ